MSTLLQSTKRLVTIFYWPSAKSKLPSGKGVGHISALFSDQTYLSHVPDKTGNSIKVGTRESIPGSTAANVAIYRSPSVRHRQFDDDEKLFGKNLYSLTLPESFLETKMKEAAQKFFLVTPPSAPKIQGPLPYYQVADSEVGKGDRSQCATTTAMVLAEGLKPENQDKIIKIRGMYMPDELWELLNQLVNSDK